MKVGTDAIMLGSWVHKSDARNALDIGCGSGVLTLMVAQRCSNESHIIALDIDKNAVAQTQRNALASRWSASISVLHDSIIDFSSNTSERFDLIVSNPPFFDIPNRKTRAYHGLDETRKRARTQQTLTLAELSESVSKLLTDEGEFYCVLPIAQADELTHLATQQHLYLTRELQVSSRAGKPPIRKLLNFSHQYRPCQSASLVIHQTDGGYSDAYKRLCRNFYLNF